MGTEPEIIDADFTIIRGPDQPPERVRVLTPGYYFKRVGLGFVALVLSAGVNYVRFQLFMIWRILLWGAAIYAVIGIIWLIVRAVAALN